jgi:hypothetical protein
MEVEDNFEFYQVNPKVTLVDYPNSPWFNAETRKCFEQVLPEKAKLVFCLLANHEEDANGIYNEMQLLQEGKIDAPDMLNFLLLKLRVDNWAQDEDLSMAKLHSDFEKRIADRSFNLNNTMQH